MQCSTKHLSPVGRELISWGSDEYSFLLSMTVQCPKQDSRAHLQVLIGSDRGLPMQPGIVGGGAALASSSIHPSHHHSCRLTGKRERGEEEGLVDGQREGGRK